jgi:hypothetical protein
VPALRSPLARESLFADAESPLGDNPTARGRERGAFSPGTWVANVRRRRFAHATVPGSGQHVPRAVDCLVRRIVQLDAERYRPEWIQRLSHRLVVGRLGRSRVVLRDSIGELGNQRLLVR